MSGVWEFDNAFPHATRIHRLTTWTSVSRCNLEKKRRNIPPRTSRLLISTQAGLPRVSDKVSECDSTGRFRPVS